MEGACIIQVGMKVFLLVPKGVEYKKTRWSIRDLCSRDIEYKYMLYKMHTECYTKQMTN